ARVAQVGSAEIGGAKQRKPRVCLCRVPAILPEPARGKPRACEGMMDISPKSDESLQQSPKLGKRLRSEKSDWTRCNPRACEGGSLSTFVSKSPDLQAPRMGGMRRHALAVYELAHNLMWIDVA